MFPMKEFKLALPVNESNDGFVSETELEDRVREFMESERGEEVWARVWARGDKAVTALREGEPFQVALDKLVES